MNPILFLEPLDDATFDLYQDLWYKESVYCTYDPRTSLYFSYIPKIDLTAVAENRGDAIKNLYIKYFQYKYLKDKLNESGS